MRKSRYLFWRRKLAYAAYSIGVLGSRKASQSEWEVGKRPMAFSFHMPRRMVRICMAMKVSLGKASLLSVKATFTGEMVSYLSNTM